MTVAATGVLEPVGVSRTVDAVMVVAFIGSENVAVTFEPTATDVAPVTGLDRERARQREVGTRLAVLDRGEAAGEQRELSLEIGHRPPGADAGVEQVPRGHDDGDVRAATIRTGGQT